MRLYTVHLKSDADPDLVPDRDAAFVKEGFAWGAFLFTFLWALVNRMWIVAGALLALVVAIQVILALVGTDQITSLAVLVGYRLLVGFAGNDLRRWTLRRRGYEDFSIVAGRTGLDAERRFFDAYPTLPRPIAPETLPSRPPRSAPNFDGPPPVATPDPAS